MTAEKIPYNAKLKISSLMISNPLGSRIAIKKRKAKTFGCHFTKKKKKNELMMMKNVLKDFCFFTTK